MQVRLLIYATATVAVVTESASGQGNADATSMTNGASVRATVGEPSAKGTHTVGPAILATVTSKDKTASGSFGTTVGTRDGLEWNPWIRGSGPLDENDATVPVTLADLSGMRTASKVAGGLNLLRWVWKPSAPAQEVSCMRVYGSPDSASDSIAGAVRTAVAAAPEARRNTVRDSVVRHLASKVCRRHHLPPGEQRQFDRLIDYGTVVLAGVSAEYGRSTFKYADTIAVAFTKAVKEPWAASVGVGVYLPNTRALFAAGVRYERSFEGGPPRQYCVPVGTTAAMQCRTLAMSAPSEEDPVLLSFETRWFINNEVGLSPRVTSDLTGKKGVGVELPILVRQAADQGFTSAVALGWRSKATNPDTDDRFYISLIVGVTYGIGVKL